MLHIHTAQGWQQNLFKQRALKHKAKATVTSPEDSDTSSDLDMSVNLIEEVSNTKKQNLEKYKETELSDYEKSEEEQAYLKSIFTDDPDILPEDADILTED